jgi:geranylgeranyl diphosphate synthase, type III
MSHKVDDTILEPWHYLRDGPSGKEMRSSLIDCFQEWLKINDEKMLLIKEIVASLHTSSLLIDDIEDNSKLRRGVPVAHSIYGIASTINCANYVYFLALEKCSKLNSPRAMNVFIQELLNLHRGQGICLLSALMTDDRVSHGISGQDILWRDHYKCPTEDQYKQMVTDKTGGLFRLAVGLMQSFSEDQTTDYVPLLNLFALYFQIRDDLLNITNTSYMQSKSFCEDITEGKFSFPVIHAILSNPEDTRLLSILRRRTDDVDVKKHAVQWMMQCDSLQYTRQYLASIKTSLLQEIDKLGGHSRLINLIESLDKQIDEST